MLDLSNDVRRQLVGHLGRSIEDNLRLADALDFKMVGIGLDSALNALSKELGEAGSAAPGT